MVEMPWSHVYERIYNTYSKILVNFLVCKPNSAIYILHHRNICKTLSVQVSSRRGSKCPLVLHLPLLKSFDNFKGVRMPVLLSWLRTLIPFTTKSEKKVICFSPPWPVMIAQVFELVQGREKSYPENKTILTILNACKAILTYFSNFLGMHLTHAKFNKSIQLYASCTQTLLNSAKAQWPVLIKKVIGREERGGN